MNRHGASSPHRGLLGLLAFFVLLLPACSGRGAAHGESSAVAPSAKLGRAPAWVIAECRSTARSVGYAVPCPTSVPATLLHDYIVGPTGCKLLMISAGCDGPWKGWVVGSSTFASPRQHLVLTASPVRVLNPARLVNGPGWYPGSKERRITSFRFHAWKVDAVFAPQSTNDGSAFANHVVLIWTVGNHTYGVGFHELGTIASTLALDRRLLEGIALVRP